MNKLIVLIKRTDIGCECFSGTIIEMVVRVSTKEEIMALIESKMIPSNPRKVDGKAATTADFSTEVLGYSDHTAVSGIITQKRIDYDRH